eukprot:TRINITY_DN5800_c0_g1_i2.p1 TRINITY_DN5800_c0_g1~~TRINITY_DN5800_c0_g1_i2.p1  ORF type:complete len:258 (-),score=38.06 TRINITY_DN5800_c0_g1_i2:24-797(-)
MPTTRRIPSDNANEPWIETISWNPRIQIYHNFLTHDECDEVIRIGEPHLRRSEVVSESPEDAVNDVRTSYGVFLDDSFMKSFALLRDIEQRCSLWTMLPTNNAEAFNLLKYEVGQQYLPHMDWFDPNDPVAKTFIGDGGNRFATVLIYLQPAEEAGGTTFPEANLVVEPKKGDAVLFWNLSPDNIPDHNALHGGIPVGKGAKWVMTKWIHEGDLDPAQGGWKGRATKEEVQRIDIEDREFRLKKLDKLKTLTNQNNI